MMDALRATYKSVSLGDYVVENGYESSDQIYPAELVEGRRNGIVFRNQGGAVGGITVKTIKNCRNYIGALVDYCDMYSSFETVGESGTLVLYSDDGTVSETEVWLKSITLDGIYTGHFDQEDKTYMEMTFNFVRTQF